MTLNVFLEKVEKEEDLLDREKTGPFPGYVPGRALAGQHLSNLLRTPLTFLVPVAFAVTVPAQALTGRLDSQTLLGTLLLAMLFWLAARWFWRFGICYYSGASA